MFANKQDKEGALKGEEIEKKFELSKLGVTYKVFESDCYDDRGMNKGFKWLAESLRKPKKELKKE